MQELLNVQGNCLKNSSSSLTEQTWVTSDLEGLSNCISKSVVALKY